MIKQWTKRYLAGALAVLIGCTTIFHSDMAYAQETNPIDEMDRILAELVIPEDITEEEIVVAEELHLEAGTQFEAQTDFTKLTFWEDKVSVTLKEITGTDKQPFDINRADTYLSVYHVEPYSGHTAYDVGRKIIVSEKEPVSESTQEDGAPDESDGSEEGDPDPESPQTELAAEHHYKTG